MHFSAYKTIQPDMPSVSLDMRVQNHCSEHFAAFQWRLGMSIKLLTFVLSATVITLCHHIFIIIIIIFIFFIQNIPLGSCSLLTPLCWHFLASFFRPLMKDLLLLLALLFGPPYLYPSEKQTVAQFSIKNPTTRLFWNPFLLMCVSFR